MSGSGRAVWSFDPVAFRRVCSNAAWITATYAAQLASGMPCPFRAATGWNCPGRGATRAAIALWHGHWRAALHDNALAVLAAPVAVLVVVLRVGGFRWRPTRPFSAPLAVGTLVALVISWTILRNCVPTWA